METTPPIYERLAIRDLSGDKKEDIASQMIEDVNTTLEYWSQMFLSALIAALGLLIDATPVVIGAMLIAPIMRPIQGTAFAIATGNKKLFFRSFWLLIKSIVLGILVAIVATRIIPLTETTNEILSRTQPTLIDLGIAFASGLVAFLALGYKKMTAGLAGVAMAASLVPPLGVIGIGIAFGSWTIGWGSTVLFMTNLIAIIFAGIGVFYLFGFGPNQKDDLKRSMINIGYVIVMLIALCVPLASSLISITKDINTQKIINSVTKEFITTIDKNIRIEDLSYTKDGIGSKNVSLSLKVPQEHVTKIDDDAKTRLTQVLASKLDKDIALDVSIIPITSVTKKQAAEPTAEQKIQQRTQEYVDVLYQGNISVISVDYYTDTKRFSVIDLYTETNIIDKDMFQQKLQDYLQEQEDLIDIILIEWRENYVEPEKEEQKKDKDLTSIGQVFDTFFTRETNINNIDLIYLDGTTQETKELMIALNITTTASPEQLSHKLEDWKIELEKQFEATISLEIIVEYLQKFSM